MAARAGRWGRSLLVAVVVTLAGGACRSGPAPSGGAAAASEAPSGTTVPVETSTTAGATPPARPPRAFRLTTTGDLLIHMPVHRQALSYGGGTSYDFRPMLAEIADEIAAADLAICHIEAPLSPDDRDLSGYPMFHTSGALADAVADAGYDTCSTASNHSLDQGPRGVVATLDELDRVGVGHAGTARSAEEAEVVAVHTVNGVRVAHLHATYGTNGIPVPSDMPWLVELIDVDRLLDQARRARAAGAEVVVVGMHWGDEYAHAPNATQRAQAARLLASPDVDLVIGQHAHVVQAAERVGTEHVIYGTGNLLSNQGAPTTPVASNDGVIVHVDFVEQPDGTWAQSVSYTPTWVDRTTYTIRRATPAANPASYQRTVDALHGLGPGAFDGTPTS